MDNNTSPDVSGNLKNTIAKQEPLNTKIDSDLLSAIANFVQNDEKNALRLKEIAEALTNGGDPATFDAELDRILGTETPERDRAVEASWESYYRPNLGQNEKE